MPRWDIDAGRPVAGRHYPRDLRQFGSWIRSEADAAAYLSAIRFRSGRVCPRCQAEVAELGEGRTWCGKCRRWFTVTTGTLLERTKVPLEIWLLVAWHLVQTKVGVSALSVQRLVGIDYRTAWFLLHKMRLAMDQDGRERLIGDVEFDETYVGGRAPGAIGRSRQNKEPVAVACEQGPGGQTGRIRLARLPDASALAIADFIAASVEPGATLHSDDWTAYAAAFEELEARGLHYERDVTTLSGTAARAHLVHPRVHRVASLLKRWLLGTHQGAVEGRHLDAYLDEFVFRFNRRHSTSRGLVFWRLVCGLLDTAPSTREEMGRRQVRRAEQDLNHAERVEAWRRERERAQDRERYRRRVEATGRSVDPYTERRDRRSIALAPQPVDTA